MNTNSEKTSSRESRTEIKNESLKFYIKETATDTALLNAETVFNEMKSLAAADQETFWVISVNCRNKIIAKDLVGLGGINYATVDLKIMFRRLIIHNASSFCIVHNHPSGDTAPSREDIALTNKIKEAAKLLDLSLLDHVIVGNSFYSFSNEGLL